jgi:hypothetical protein
MQASNQPPFYNVPAPPRRRIWLPILIGGVVAVMLLGSTLMAVIFFAVVFYDTKPPFPSLPAKQSISYNEKEAIKKHFAPQFQNPPNFYVVANADLYRLDDRRKITIMDEFDRNFADRKWQREEIGDEIHYYTRETREQTYVVKVIEATQARNLSYLPLAPVNTLQPNEALLLIVTVYQNR